MSDASERLQVAATTTVKKVAGAAATVACAVAILTGGCGKSGPAGPSGPGSNGGAIANTFIGVLSAPSGFGGTVQLRAASSLASLTPVGVQALLERMFSLVTPVVHAQNSAASGILIADAGPVVSLSGSFGGGTFNVSGGGYTVTATVTGTSITGSATLPGGQTAVVSASEPITAPSPPPASATGFYVGSYRIEALAKYRNTLPTDGSVLIDCTYTAVVVGDITLELVDRPNGTVESELSYRWTETEAGRTCPFVVIGSPISPGPGVMYFSGPPTALTFGRVDQGPSGQGVVIRLESFVGALSGNTVVGRVSRSFQFTSSNASPPRDHISWYPTTSTAVTLVKR